MVHSGASFNGATGLTELDTSETDTGARTTYTVSSKQYLQFAPDSVRTNGIDVMLVGATASDSNGVSTTMTYGAANGVLDELPEVPAATWSNAAARESIENDPSGEKIDAVYAGDGTYNATTAFPQGDTATATENADTSGLYQFPLVGVSGSEVEISAVSNNAIDVTFKNTAGGTVSWGSFPVWYPQTPPVLASDRFTDAGTVAIPATCNVPASIGTSGTRIDETRARLDSVYGELERTTQSSYVVPGYGDVCVVLHDDLTVYYDYSGQSPFIFGGYPMREVITDETLGMTKGSPVSQSRRTRADARALAAASTFAAPSMARMHLAAAKQHLQFARHLRTAIKEVR